MPALIRVFSSCTIFLLFFFSQFTRVIILVTFRQFELTLARVNFGADVPPPRDVSLDKNV